MEITCGTYDELRQQDPLRPWLLADAIVLCDVCEEPVRPTLSLYAGWDGERLRHGHKQCVEETTS